MRRAYPPENYTIDETPAVDGFARTFIVVNPDGERYQTSEAHRGWWVCSCPGYRHRGKCKHPALIRERVGQTAAV